MHAEPHSVHGAITKYFSNSFVFKTEIEKEGLPGDITPALGSGALSKARKTGSQVWRSSLLGPFLG